MIKKLTLVFLAVCSQFIGFAQEEEPIKIVEERVANRLMLYAVNESDTDYDLIIKVSGTNFRQSKGRDRAIRVPAISKVHVKNLILSKGKQPVYTYKLTLNDSLSRRALKKPATRIRIDPKKRIVVYITEACANCSDLLTALEESKYNYSIHTLSEEANIKEQLSKVLPELETLTNPVIALGGSLYQNIENYEQLIEALNK